MTSDLLANLFNSDPADALLDFLWPAEDTALDWLSSDPAIIAEPTLASDFYTVTSPSSGSNTASSLLDTASSMGSMFSHDGSPSSPLGSFSPEGATSGTLSTFSTFPVTPPITASSGSDSSSPSSILTATYPPQGGPPVWAVTEMLPFGSDDYDAFTASSSSTSPTSSLPSAGSTAMATETYHEISPGRWQKITTVTFTSEVLPHWIPTPSPPPSTSTLAAARRAAAVRDRGRAMSREPGAGPSVVPLPRTSTTPSRIITNETKPKRWMTVPGQGRTMFGTEMSTTSVPSTINASGASTAAAISSSNPWRGISDINVSGLLKSDGSEEMLPSALLTSLAVLPVLNQNVKRPFAEDDGESALGAADSATTTSGADETDKRPSKIRKRTVITQERKQEITTFWNECFQRGETPSYADVGKRFGLPRNTVFNIIHKQKAVIESSTKVAKELTVSWVRHQLLLKIPVNGKQIMAQAIEVHRLLAGQLVKPMPPCQYLTGWLHNFKSKYNLDSATMGRELSVAPGYYHKINFIRDQCFEYGPDTIFTIDETRMFDQFVPVGTFKETRSLAGKDKSAVDESEKEQKKSTVVLGCNASGTIKFEPLILDQESSDGPRISDWNASTVHYLEVWLRDLDKTMRKRVVFLVSGELAGVLRDCRLYYIQITIVPNGSEGALTLPMRAGIVKEFKAHYHAALALASSESATEAKPSATPLDLESSDMLNRSALPGSRGIGDMMKMMVENREKEANKKKDKERPFKEAWDAISPERIRYWFSKSAVLPKSMREDLEALGTGPIADNISGMTTAALMGSDIKTIMTPPAAGIVQASHATQALVQAIREYRPDMPPVTAEYYAALDRDVGPTLHLQLEIQRMKAEGNEFENQFKKPAPVPIQQTLAKDTEWRREMPKAFSEDVLDGTEEASEDDSVAVTEMVDGGDFTPVVQDLSAARKPYAWLEKYRKPSGLPEAEPPWAWLGRRTQPSGSAPGAPVPNSSAPVPSSTPTPVASAPAITLPVPAINSPAPAAWPSVPAVSAVSAQVPTSTVTKEEPMWMGWEEMDAIELSRPLTESELRQEKRAHAPIPTAASVMPIPVKVAAPMSARIPLRASAPPISSAPPAPQERPIDPRLEFAAPPTSAPTAPQASRIPVRPKSAAPPTSEPPAPQEKSAALPTSWSPQAPQPRPIIPRRELPPGQPPLDPVTLPMLHLAHPYPQASPPATPSPPPVLQQVQLPALSSPVTYDPMAFSSPPESTQYQPQQQQQHQQQQHQQQQQQQEELDRRLLQLQYQVQHQQKRQQRPQSSSEPLDSSGNFSRPLQNQSGYGSSPYQPASEIALKQYQQYQQQQQQQPQYPLQQQPAPPRTYSDSFTRTSGAPPRAPAQAPPLPLSSGQAWQPSQAPPSWSATISSYPVPPRPHRHASNPTSTSVVEAQESEYSKDYDRYYDTDSLDRNLTKSLSIKNEKPMDDGDFRDRASRRDEDIGGGDRASRRRGGRESRRGSRRSDSREKKDGKGVHVGTKAVGRTGGKAAGPPVFKVSIYEMITLEPGVKIEDVMIKQEEVEEVAEE